MTVAGRVRAAAILTSTLAVVLGAGGLTTGTSASASSSGGPYRYLVVLHHARDLPAVKAFATREGGSVVLSMPAIGTLVVRSTGVVRAEVHADPRVAGIAADRLTRIAPAPFARTGGMKRRVVRAASDSTGAAPRESGASVTPDPAFTLAGLMWNYSRLGLPSAWSKTAGQGWVTVGVVDTGIDYTHSEMARKVAGVHDFTNTEDPPICSTMFGLPTDQQLATAFGTAPDEDFNGRGTWIGGEIAARLDGAGVNGIAPKVVLFALKVAQNCGVAYDSTIISAILYAARQGMDVVDIPFAQYLDRTKRDQNLVYEAYVASVKRATAEGTVVVAAAGDQHTDIGAGGLVGSHGILSDPPGGGDDFSLSEVPGGVPGVIDVSATNRVVNAASTTPCPSDSLAAGNHQWCKPITDPHQPFGAGKTNQLAYYSNYGPRIDIAAPGGARKFNLPTQDRGGSEGWPWTGTNSVEGGTSTSDGTNAWQEFGITSDFSTEVPCFTYTSNPVFPDNQCYTILQGTAMASANASGVLALLLSSHPSLMGNVAGLTKLLLASVTSAHNHTPPVARFDKTNMDSTSNPCTGGDCHLGGAAISDDSAYGAGIVTLP